MGIQGLLPFLDKASRQCHVSEFRGSTVAVDTYCWLHKGAFGCAEKLIRGQDTDGYVTYCLKYINLLQNYGIRVVMVFDGRFLPAKKGTEEKRREARKKAKKQVVDLLHIGNVQDARRYMAAAVNVTHQMALNLIKQCRKLKIDCIVAPYEADAQLAYLNVKNLVDFVITEDSDLLLFGCNKILFKMDLNGSGTLVESNKLHICMNLRPDVYTFDKFRYMCIISGCDYLESLPGIGLKKALKFITLTADTNIYNVLSKMPSYLKMKNLQVTNEYKEGFMIADATFKHQLIYDPISRGLLPLQDPNILGTKQEYCVNAGDFFDSEIAFQLALGNLDPFTLEKMDSWLPNVNELSGSSIWSKFYKNDVKKTVAVTSIDKFVKVSKREEIDKIDDELRRTNYTIELQKELEVYKTPSTKRKISEGSPKEEKEEEEAISPVIRKHSIFANRKKISKFNITDIGSISNPTTSKFFGNKQSIPVNRELINTEPIYKEEIESVLIPLKDNSCQDNIDNEKCNEEKEFKYESKAELTTYRQTVVIQESSVDDVLRRRSVENLIITDDELDLSQKENITTSNINVKKKIILNTKVLRSKKIETIKKNQNVKLPKNQPTLLSMFQKK